MTKSTRPAAIAALAALSLAVACTPLQRDSAAADTPPDYGKLQLLNVTTTPRIDSLTFRGTLRNQFDEPVEGIRVVLRILQDPSETAPVLAHAQTLLDTHLEPGGHTAFEIDAKVRPTSLANAGLYLYGFAVRRGGKELPVSPLWEQ